MSDWTGKELETYRVIEKWKEDSLLTIYKAYDTHLDREIHLAVLLAENNMAPEFIAHFRHEALTLARLDHPNILAIYDYGVSEGVPYLVQEPAPSKTLKDLSQEATPWMNAIQQMLPVADAIRYAHSKMVTHQDIRPSNILIDDQGKPKLTGFGIVQILEGVEGLPLSGIGDPVYKSPEQGKGETVDARADIYSFAVILYELIAGRVPFQADTPFAVTFKHISEPVPSLHQFVPDLPVAVEDAVLKALNKQPTDRYADMEAVISALNDLLASREQTSIFSAPKEDSTHAETQMVARPVLSQSTPNEPQMIAKPVVKVPQNEPETILQTGKLTTERPQQADPQPVFQAETREIKIKPEMPPVRSKEFSSIPEPSPVSPVSPSPVKQKSPKDWTKLSIFIVIFLILASLGLIVAVVFSSPTGRAWFSDQFSLGNTHATSSAPLPSRTVHLTHTPRPTRSVPPRTPTSSASTQAPFVAATEVIVVATEAPYMAATEAPPQGYGLNPGNYTIILRYQKDSVLQGFYQVQTRLEALGYIVSFSEGYGVIGEVDAVLYGNPDSLLMIEEIRGQIADLLTLPYGDPIRFDSSDASYNNYVIVIQIVDETLFSMY
jgi:eukaryotic-like serine/threonine-protein kinase